jgi:hypothetical protein
VALPWTSSAAVFGSPNVRWLSPLSCLIIKARIVTPSSAAAPLSGSSIPEHGIRLRDDFTQRTIADVAKAVGYRCSNPDCQRVTVGSKAEHDGVINIGVAAHITAASSGGPRYDEDADAETRRGKDNCIWLCQDCAKLIDSDSAHFSVPLLQDWKRSAEDRTFRELVAPQRRPGGAEEEAKKIEAALGDRKGRARFAIDVAHEVCIIAPPGTGKTTTLLQLADAMLASRRP